MAKISMAEKLGIEHHKRKIEGKVWTRAVKHSSQYAALQDAAMLRRADFGGAAKVWARVVPEGGQYAVYFRVKVTRR